MRSYYVYLKDYKKETLIAPMFKMLESGFELLTPLIMASIIDRGIQNGDKAHIWKMFLVLIGISTMGLASALVAQYYASKAAAGFGTGLRDAFYEHINQFSYRELDAIGTSTLITRITSDINQIQSGVNLVLRLLLRAPIIVIGAVIMAFTISVKLTLIFLVTMPLLSLVIFGVMRVSIPLHKKVQKALDHLVLLMRENYIGVRVVRAYGRQKDEIKAFDQASEEVKNRQVHAGKIAGLMNPMTYLLVNLGIICILYVGGNQISIGTLSQGEIIALVSYMVQILNALVALAHLIMSVTRSLGSGGRVKEIMDRRTTLSDVGNEEQRQQIQKPLVVFDRVDFSYKGGDPVLSDISFSVMAGETIGVIGGTGAGKSTLVQLIPRFYDVISGSIKVEGNDVKTYPFAQLRGKVGVVPQKAVLFSGTIGQNMRWGNPDATEDEIMEALSIAMASEFVKEKGGLEAKVLAGGKNFSGGQKQRLTIARALVKKPEILILDDSASALDLATDARLRKNLRKHTRGMTVFLVSQRVTTVKQANRILVLDDGKLVGVGTHEELWTGCGIYQEICLSQLKGEEVAR